jgi:hypothetical protein
MTNGATDARNDEIYTSHAAGEGVGSLALRYGLSRKRIYQLLKKTHRRQQFRAFGLSVRAWNILVNLGVLRRQDEFDRITRDELVARIQTVDLLTIGAQRNCGVTTINEIAAFVGCSDRFKQRGTGMRVVAPP